MDLALTLIISLLGQFVACAYLRARWSLLVAVLWPTAVACVVCLIRLHNWTNWPNYFMGFWIFLWPPSMIACLITPPILIWLQKRDHINNSVKIDRLAIFSGGLVVSLLIAWNAVEFFGGYFVFPLGWPFFIVPTSGLVLLFFVVASSWALMVSFTSLVRRRFRLGATLAVIFCLAWAFSPWFFAHAIFLHGLAARLRSVTTPGEIESAAELCNSLLPNGGYIVGPHKFMATDYGGNEQAWNALSKYGFVHLKDDSCAIFVRPEGVSFEWGGALPGHWGIYVLGPNQSDSMNEYLDSIRYSDKILLFRDH